MGELDARTCEYPAAFVLHGVHGALVDCLHGSSRQGRRRTANEVADLVDRALAALRICQNVRERPVGSARRC